MLKNSLLLWRDLRLPFEKLGEEKLFFPENILISSVVIDDREAKENSLFIAIKGENNDGHKYIRQAIENGAVFIVCEHLNDEEKDFLKQKGIGYAVVKNSIEALKDIAIFQRNRLKAKVIGITGNVGKTTTRLMLFSVFSKFFKTFTASKNYNNHIGLPLTICNTPLDTEVLILEMGMNHTGEIDYLTKIACPDVAIITNITNAHLGNFKNVSEIVEAKAEIFNGLEKNGFVCLNESNEYFLNLLEIAKSKGIGNILKVGGKNSNVFVVEYEFTDNFTTKYKVHCNREIVDCEIQDYKFANVENSLFVFAVAENLGIKPQKVAECLRKFSAVEGRGNIEDIKTKEGKTIKIINDCYNSSPEALKASIRALGVLKEKNKDKNKRIIAIVGDMLELGEKSKQLHEEIADVLVENKINYIVLIGEESRAIFENLPDDVEKLFFQKTEDFENEIENFTKDGDVLLFKASHSFHFDKLIQKLKG